MNGRIQKRGILRALATAAPALALCCLLGGAPALYAGQKTSGNNTITDDLATGFGGSVGLTGVGTELTGGLGQVMTVTALNLSAGSTKAEAGYFSMVVDTPTTADFYQVFNTSMNITWTSVANPEGTQYIIELSTAGDFTALASSSVFTGSPGTLAGLAANTTYYAHIKAVYGDSDESGWLAVGSTVTAASMPLVMAPTGVSSGSITANWDANGNPDDTVYYIQIASVASYAPFTASSQTVNNSVSFGGLLSNTTYFMRVYAINRAGSPTVWVDLASTSTWIEAPTSVYFDDISTTATAGEYSIAVSSTGITNIKNLVIENRTSDPPSPVSGQIWLRTDLE